MTIRIAAAALLAGVCAVPASGAAMIDGATVDFERIGEGFERPVMVAPLPGDGRLLVVEKTGVIRFLEEGRPGAVFLDVSDQVSDGNEQGLLGLAFEPAFSGDGAVYVNFTDRAGDTQIVRYETRDGLADPASAETVLSVPQPEGNHNGGWIGFGPDGMLYIGMGDGGGGGDDHGPIGNGQDPDALLGKILRIDPVEAGGYAIPPGNPFAEGGGAPEIFLLGVRNPWRNAFDGNLLYVADVGQGNWEELSVVDVTSEAGANLGWRVLEGRSCYPADAMCVQGGFTMPVHVYPTDTGCSITGGVVYRGTALPALEGRYFFADYCTGVVEALRVQDGVATGLVNTEGELGSIGNVISFGTDAEGEMLLLTEEGVVFRMVPG